MIRRRRAVVVASAAVVALSYRKPSVPDRLSGGARPYPDHRGRQYRQPRRAARNRSDAMDAGQPRLENSREQDHARCDLEVVGADPIKPGPIMAIRMLSHRNKRRVQATPFGSFFRLQNIAAQFLAVIAQECVLIDRPSGDGAHKPDPLILKSPFGACEAGARDGIESCRLSPSRDAQQGIDGRSMLAEIDAVPTSSAANHRWRPILRKSVGVKVESSEPEVSS